MDIKSVGSAATQQISTSVAQQSQESAVAEERQGVDSFNELKEAVRSDTGADVGKNVDIEA